MSTIIVSGMEVSEKDNCYTGSTYEFFDPAKTYKGTCQLKITNRNGNIPLYAEGTFKVY